MRSLFTSHARYGRIGLVGTIVVLGLAVSGRAATFSVDPTHIYFSADIRSQLLTLRNVSDRPVRFQLTAHAWSQAVDGRMELSPTEDLVVFPTLLTLEAGMERRVRIGVMVPPSVREQTYRVFVEELPSLVGESEAQLGIAVRMKMGIPVFLQPAETTAQGSIADLGLRDGTVSFDVANTGTMHFVPDRVRVRALDASGAPIHELQLEAWYILAAGRRHYDVELPRLECERIDQVTVDAEVNGSVLEASFQTPVACPPAGAQH